MQCEDAVALAWDNTYLADYGVEDSDLELRSAPSEAVPRDGVVTAEGDGVVNGCVRAVALPHAVENGPIAAHVLRCAWGDCPAAGGVVAPILEVVAFAGHRVGHVGYGEC